MQAEKCAQYVHMPATLRYQAVSDITRAVFRRYDPAFESGSLDEAYLDVTNFCRRMGMSGAQVGKG